MLKQAKEVEWDKRDGVRILGTEHFCLIFFLKFGKFGWEFWGRAYFVSSSFFKIWEIWVWTKFFLFDVRGEISINDISPIRFCVKFELYPSWENSEQKSGEVRQKCSVPLCLILNKWIKAGIIRIVR